MRETRTMEFKETITNTFLKTVSAFSNYDGGVILFGVDDEGNREITKSCSRQMDSMQICITRSLRMLWHSRSVKIEK
mgnify:CR=1 FL=1